MPTKIIKAVKKGQIHSNNSLQSPFASCEHKIAKAAIGAIIKTAAKRKPKNINMITEKMMISMIKNGILMKNLKI